MQRAIVQLGEGISVNTVALSPDGELTSAGGSPGVIRLYRTSDGALLRILEGHTNKVMSVAFAPDGQTIASGSSDGTVRLWQVNSGKSLRSLKGHKWG